MAKKKIPDWMIIGGGLAVFFGGVAAVNKWGGKTASAGVGDVDGEEVADDGSSRAELADSHMVAVARNRAQSARQRAREARRTAAEQRARHRAAQAAADRAAEEAAAAEQSAATQERLAEREMLSAERKASIYA